MCVCVCVCVCGCGCANAVLAALQGRDLYTYKLNHNYFALDLLLCTVHFCLFVGFFFFFFLMIET